MAHPKPDFTIKWGTLDEPIAPIADIDQNNGWSFLGNTPPTAAQFDYMMALYDKRDAWLEEQLPSGGTTSFIRTLLDDSTASDARTTIGAKYTSTLASSGKYELPGGLIVQWGIYTASAVGKISGNFTSPFPNEHYGSVGSFFGAFSTAQGASVKVEKVGLSSFNFAVVSNAGAFSASPCFIVHIGR